MARPEGILKKTKNNSRKNYRAAAEWKQRKCQGRPQQQYNESTGQWGKIMLPRKVEQ
jgi:hypothetical protein